VRLAGFLVAAALAAAFLVPGGRLAPAAAQDGEGEYAGLPEGPGREAVYYTCRACHSVKQFTQQRLDREAWDALLTTMVRDNGMAEPEPWARTLMLNYLATHFGEAQDEDWAGLPPGPGREEVFSLCQACHSLAIVKQQGLSKKSWTETLHWMVEEQGMPELDPPEMELVADYLATHYGVDSHGGGTGGMAPIAPPPQQ
jgi:cytochrome c